MSTNTGPRTVEPNRVTAKRTAPNFKSAPVDTYFDMPLYEHYNVDGFLLLITSDPDTIDLEPGDFVVKRDWRTSVVPYVHHEMPVAEEEASTRVGFLSTNAHLPCHSIQCASCFPQMGDMLAEANAAMRANL